MRKFLILLMLFVLSSCVGTVQDAKVKLNNLFEEDKNTLNFPGLEEARAVSHNKVELEFTPVGDSNPNLKYLLYINNSISPIEINPDSLDKAASGRVRYLVDGLAIDSKYKFKLRLKNTQTGTFSKNEKELTADTFDNKTADFKGITSVTKVNGQSDTSVRVDWVSALMAGSTTTGPWDPLYYEVTIIGQGGVANLNNPAYTGPDKRKIRVPPSPTNLSPFNYTNWTTLVVGSLEPNTQYYVQVRAVNRLYDEFLQDPDVTIIPVDKEINTKFMTIRTDPATGVFDFNVESFKAVPGAGSQAKTRIINSWIPASGTFVGYRLFYMQCTGPQCNTESEVMGTDLLTDEIMEDIVAGSVPNGGYIASNVLTSPTTSYALTGLDPYKWYQLKLVACRNTGCSKDSGDAIASSLRAVRTAPILAPFSGLTAIRHPDTATSMDQINLQFDVPDLSTGYADRMEFFCINPDSVTEAQDDLEYTQIIPGSTVAGSPVARCNGISICGPNASDCDSDSLNYTLSTGTSVRLKGIKTDGTRYCFAAFPAIRDEVEEVPATDPTQDWIVRCITPEVKTPTIAEFSGISSSCNVVNNTIGVTWQKPVAGIYSAYRVLWRKISGSDTYSFSDAATDVKDNKVNTVNSPYGASPTLDPDTLNYTISDLRPGTRYKIGVLTQTLGADIKWSEYNTNIKDCVTAMPRYKFEEWTRIFAIGPKVDGRFPYKRDYIDGIAVRSIMTDAYVYEAINHDGVPYELSINNVDNTVDLDGVYFKAPGSYGGTYSPAGFGDDFDGAPGSLGDGSGTLIAASNRGVVSLAWRDVTLDFLANEFKDCQVNSGEATANSYCYRNPAGLLTLPTQKKDRRYGYKVFRSADNRLSWQDITKSSTDADTVNGSSLIYAKDYSYYKRADQAATVERMAFFTDYSVQAMKTEPTQASKARIYWYRIIPYFDNKQISLDPTQSGLTNAPNEIKVILPPDNMALMHRWMANRQACNEIERGAMIDKAAHYTCAYNGFGAKAKGFPWNPTNTVVDLGGHMLIDRFELGCNYTRGDVNALPTNEGNSQFDRDAIYDGFASQLAEFRGYATNEDGSDNTSKRFMGCAQRQAGSFSSTLVQIPWGAGMNTQSNYRKFIQGDCVGYGVIRMAGSDCTASPDDAIVSTYAVPGSFFEAPGGGDPGDIELDCANSTPTKPTVSGEYFSLAHRKNVIIQSEFAGVMHHTYRGNALYINPEGPTGNTLNWSGDEAAHGKMNSCYINLAAIGPAASNSNWIARWFPVNDLEIVKGTADLTHNTIGQLSANGNLYNATTYRFPDAGMHNDARFGDNTKIGRVVSSNSAKLPPITNLSTNMAQSLCSAYEVEVGFSNNGSNFLNLSLPKQKRLMGRQELVSASAWPEASDNGYPENYDYKETTASPRITTIEGSNNPGYCVDNGKAQGQNVPTHATTMGANMTRRYYPIGEAPTGAGNGSTVLFGGSSHNDGNGTTQSQLCVSKYGIQDLIGNAAEITTDRIFCDYGADKLYFGRYESGQGYELESARMPDYDGTGEEDIIWLGAKVLKETGTGDVELVSGTSTQGRMWADISPNSGYCSLVDDVDPGTGYGTLVSRFRDNNDNFINVLKPDQTLNTDMVKRSNPIVQTNIDKLRNGDGYFLNFGTNTPGPYLQRSNSWALSKSGITYDNGMALGPYFNPIIGLTMRCPGSTCNQSEDNMIASTSYFMDDPDSPKPGVEPSIPRFPAGNSQLMNYGISETSYVGGSTSFSIDFSDPMARRGTQDVVYEIKILLNGSVQYSRMPMRSWALMQFGNFANAGIQNFSKLRFDLPRGSALHFTHGADATSSKTGRYSLQTLIGSRLGAQRTGAYTAARCGVLIED